MFLAEPGRVSRRTDQLSHPKYQANRRGRSTGRIGQVVLTLKRTISRRAERWPGEVPTPGNCRFDERKLACRIFGHDPPQGSSHLHPGLSPSRIRRVVRGIEKERRKQFSRLASDSPTTRRRSPHPKPVDPIEGAKEFAQSSTAQLEEAVSLLADAPAPDRERLARIALGTLITASAAVGHLRQTMRANRGALSEGRRLGRLRDNAEKKIKKLAKAVPFAIGPFLVDRRSGLPPFQIRFDRTTLAESLRPSDGNRRGYRGFGYDLSEFAWECARCKGLFFALTAHRIYCRECADSGRRETRKVAARNSNRKRRAIGRDERATR